LEPSKTKVLNSQRDNDKERDFLSLSLSIKRKPIQNCNIKIKKITELIGVKVNLL
jgi:hypothetical protein